MKCKLVDKNNRNYIYWIGDFWDALIQKIINPNCSFRQSKIIIYNGD